MTLDEIIDNYKHRDAWLRAFQKFCDSDEIRKESEKTGINACGYGIQCDICNGSDNRLACAESIDEYYRSKRLQINYRNTGEEYFRKLLSGGIGEKA